MTPGSASPLGPPSDEACGASSRYSPALDLHPVLGVPQDSSAQQVMGDWSVTS